MANNKKRYCYLILVAFISIAITSLFSPLFNYDGWSDPGCFYTVGSGMMHGLVPYKDFFEQKGPLLYLIFGIASLIKPKWDIFLGGYFLGVIVLSASMIILYKIIKLVTKNDKVSFATTLLLPVIQCSGIVGVSGGVPEDISIPLILGLIYFTLKFMNNDYQVSLSSVFIQGILFGLVFWMKYTVIGAWIGLGIVTTIILIKKKRLKKLFEYIGMALGGFLLTSIPWIIYFGVNHALGDLWQTYFYYNIGFYHDTTPFFIKVITAMWYTIFPWTDGFSSGFGDHLSAIVWIIFITFEFIAIFSNRIFKNWTQKIVILVMLFCNGGLEYWGGFHWIQYKLILVPFIAFSLVYLACILIQKDINLGYIFVIIMTLLTLIVINGNIRGPHSRLMMNLLGNERYEQKWGDPEPAQLEFAKIMHEKEKHPTLLTYDNMCAEFYYAADIQPVNRFFVKLASTKKEYPPMMEDQRKVVKNKDVDFVLIQTTSKKELYSKYKNVLVNYKLITSRNGYYLLEKR